MITRVRPGAGRLLASSKYLLAVAVLFAGGGVSGNAAAQGRSPAGGEPPFVPGEVLIQFRAGVSEAEQDLARGMVAANHDEMISAQGDRRDGRGDLELARLPPGLEVAAAVRQLQAHPAVEFAEPNWIYHHQATSNDTFYTNGTLWGMYGDASSPTNQYGSQAGEAWARGNVGSNDVFVAVIDEGIMHTHADLSANIWHNPFDPVDGIDNDGNGFVDDVNGWDFAGNDNTVYDGGTSDKHGTHVAGTIGAVGGNGSGVAGVNWAVTIISAKFLGKNGGTTANAIKAVNYVTKLKTQHGLNIVATNNSWGGGGFAQGLLDAINDACSANILFVAAAGNGGRDGVGDNNDQIQNFPANYSLDTTVAPGSPCVIAVAAIDKVGNKASFSNYGSKSVHLGAPGVSITSTLPGKAGTSAYGAYSGTSMATPHVTGAIALYAASHPGLSAADLKAAIMGAVVPTPSLAGKTISGGRLNVDGF